MTLVSFQQRHCIRCLQGASRALAHFSSSPAVKLTVSSPSSNSAPSSSSQTDVFYSVPSVTVSADTSAFSKLGLCSELMGALKLMGLSQPTGIQSLAVPEMLKRQNLILASQTGSGKTLAYAMPLLHMLRQDEKRPVNPVNCRVLRPRALIILPTRELCYQVHQLCKQLSHHARVRVACLTGGPGMRGVRKKLENSAVDVLVGTPGSLTKYAEKRKNPIVFADVEYVVVDEADTMYGKSRRHDKQASRRQHYDMGTTEFDEEMKDLLFPITERVEKAKTDKTIKNCQFVFVTASLPPTITGRILDEFPDAKRVASKTLHKVPPLLRQVFVRVGNRDKLELLDEVITAQESKRSSESSTQPTLALAPLRPEVAAALPDRNPARIGNEDVADRITKVPTIVFTNTVAACRAASLFLAGRGYSVAAYHGSMPPERRAESFNSFVKGERKIMVSTDLGSRGLDTSMVQHVIMMDFPRTTQDYLHRAGRTARAGTKGLVTCFIKGRDVRLARDLEKNVSVDVALDRRVALATRSLVRKSRLPAKKKQRIWYEQPGVPRKGVVRKTNVRWEAVRMGRRRKPIFSDSASASHGSSSKSEASASRKTTDTKQSQWRSKSKDKPRNPLTASNQNKPRKPFR